MMASDMVVFDVRPRDLQSLLQKSIGEELTLLEFQAQNLLPKGENYASTVLKITATIQRNNNGPKEDLELVAKMIAATKFQRDNFNTTISFKKEIFIFEQLIPAYRQLQKEVEFGDSELLNIAPKIYGSRLSLDLDSQEADEDVILLMENLIVSGFRTMDRLKGKFVNK